MKRRNGSVRRYGLLGFPFSRLPSEDTSYSSLDNVTWSTARALGRRGEAVVVGAWERHDVPIRCRGARGGDGRRRVRACTDPVDARAAHSARGLTRAGSAHAPRNTGWLLVSRLRNRDHEIGRDRAARGGATTSNSRPYCEEEQRCQAV